MRSAGEDRREGVRRRPPTNKQGRRRTHDNPHLYICGSGLQPRTETIFPLPSRERAGEREQHITLSTAKAAPSPPGRGAGGEGTNITLSTAKARAGARGQHAPGPTAKATPSPRGDGP